MPIGGRCVVCFEDFRSGDDLTYLPCDGYHCYHTKCILQWLRRNSVCPICRKEMTESTMAANAVTEEALGQHYAAVRRAQSQLNISDPEIARLAAARAAES